MSIEGNGNTLLYRVDKLEDQVKEAKTVAEAAAREVGKHEEQISGDRGLSKAVATLADEIKSLRRAIYGASFTVVAGAVLMVLQLAGQGVG